MGWNHLSLTAENVNPAAQPASRVQPRDLQLLPVKPNLEEEEEETAGPHLHVSTD